MLRDLCDFFGDGESMKATTRTKPSHVPDQYFLSRMIAVPLGSENEIRNAGDGENKSR